MTEMKSFPSEPLEPEVTYDPYAKIVVNVHQPVYAGTTTLELYAHEVTSLKNNDKLRTQRLTKLDASIEDVRNYLIDNYEELDNHADEIAALLDIELVKTVEVMVNVTFNTTVELAIGKDVSDIDYSDFELTIESSNSDFEISDYDTDVIYIRES